MAFAEQQKLRCYVLGGGSNIVVPDSGVEGLVIAIDLHGLQVSQSSDRHIVRARAGESWDSVVLRSIELGLSGIECLSGIPGLVGATPIQNVGAYGQEISDTLSNVRAFDRRERQFVTLTRNDCRFGYRDSRFKSEDPHRFVVTEVALELEQGSPSKARYPELERALHELGREPTLSDVRRAVLTLRQAKSMVLLDSDENSRSCGSFFVNPVVPENLANEVERRFEPLKMPRYPEPRDHVKLSAAWLIERSGLTKGMRHGNVGISSRHALALVCHEGATASELLAFAEVVRARVREQSGVELTPEPSIWG